jgi:hypothetical protein
MVQLKVILTNRCKHHNTCKANDKEYLITANSAPGLFLAPLADISRIFYTASLQVRQPVFSLTMVLTYDELEQIVKVACTC